MAVFFFVANEDDAPLYHRIILSISIGLRRSKNEWLLWKISVLDATHVFPISDLFLVRHCGDGASDVEWYVRCEFDCASVWPGSPYLSVLVAFLPFRRVDRWPIDGVLVAIAISTSVWSIPNSWWFSNWFPIRETIPIDETLRLGRAIPHAGNFDRVALSPHFYTPRVTAIPQQVGIGFVSIIALSDQLLDFFL